MTETWCKCGLFVLVVAFEMGAKAQSGPSPIKSGLWQTTVSGTSTVALPPEQEAKIAALPAEQQAMIRNMSGGGRPTTITTKSCAAQATSVDALMSQTQKNMKCTYSNRTQTATGASFDVNCVSPQGTTAGHAQFQMADSDHMTGSMHMTVDATGRSGAMHMTINNSITSKYLGADCGSVKPGTAEVVQ